MCANSLNNCVQHLPTFTAWSSIDFKVSRVTMSLSFSIFEEQRTLLALPALDPGAWGEPPPVHAPRRSSCRLPPVVLAACCCLCVAALKLLHVYVKGNRKNAILSILDAHKKITGACARRTHVAVVASGVVGFLVSFSQRASL